MMTVLRMVRMVVVEVDGARLVQKSGNQLKESRTRLPQEPDRPWIINHLATLNFR